MSSCRYVNKKSLRYGNQGGKGLPKFEPLTSPAGPVVGRHPPRREGSHLTAGPALI